MSFSDVFNVIKQLIFDWRLIVAFAVIILYLNFVFYVSKYKKKKEYNPKRVIRKKSTSGATGGDGQASGASETDSSAQDSDQDNFA